MMQERLLLHNVNIGVKLWQNRPEFSLLSAEAAKNFNIKILDAKLKLCHVVLDPAVSVAISDGLNLKPIQYPFISSNIKTHTIASGAQSATISDVFSGKCPNKLFVCLVSSESMNGTFSQNPYFFQHFDLCEIGFYINNSSFPGKPLQLKFEDSAFQSHYMEAWLRLLEINPDINITFEEFHRGYSIFAFDLSNKEGKDLIPTTRIGETKLELRFSKALPKSITAILYGKFKSVLTIDSARNVIIQ